jgi:hypothetical protein
MIELSYCPELNIYRIRNIVSGKETTRTYEQLLKAGIDKKILNDCKNQAIEF